MNNKLIIFDCDGVLVDSEIVSNRIYAEIITQHGYPLTAEESIRRFTGITYQNAQEIISKESGIQFPENFAKFTEDSVVQALKNELLPLMTPLLTHPILKNLNKCVASNSSKPQILHSLHITQQHIFFNPDHIFTAQDVPNPKPAPDLFLHAAKKLGYHPKNCLVIEDSPTGIQAAQSANMPVTAFLAGTHTTFPWYQQRIQTKNIPIANNHQELISIIQNFLEN